MNRRLFIGVLAASALGAGIAGKGYAMGFFGGKDKEENDFPVSYSEAEWRERLTPEQFRVLRKEGTEPAFSSPLNENKEKGVYHCAGCEAALYSSAHKFDSGTGWPSFWKPINSEAVGNKRDFVLLMPRTEEHCATCGGHLGHVFDDGPEPTGKRHCINGVALTFKAA